MKFAVDKNENHTVFAIQESKLNSVKAPEFKTEVVLLFNEGVQNLILDMTDVEFVDSSGLSAILVANRLCESAEGNLLLVNVHENVDRLIKICQLEGVLSVMPDLLKAIDFLRMLELTRELEMTDDNSTDTGVDKGE